MGAPGWAALCLPTLVAFFNLTIACAADPAPTPEKPPDAPAWQGAGNPTEEVVRKRFLLMYQTAATPEVKAEAVKMLKGQTSKESRRMLAGMLADPNEKVRIAACQTMAMTDDDDGYFVKPLMGALTDSSDFVRIAAAEALGAAHVRADAIKAITYSLVILAGGMKGGDDEKERNKTLTMRAYNSALERLTSHHARDNDPQSISSFWMDYWNKNEDELRAKDKALRPPEAEPVRSQGLAPDTFDKPAEKTEKRNETPKK